jgi:hypothetical protein
MAESQNVHHSWPGALLLSGGMPIWRSLETRSSCDNRATGDLESLATPSTPKPGRLDQGDVMSIKGWYADLEAMGRERYFDRAEWTDRYRDAPKSTPESTPEEQRAKRLRSLTWSLALCTFPVAMLLLRAGALLSGIRRCRCCISAVVRAHADLGHQDRGVVFHLPVSVRAGGAVDRPGVARGRRRRPFRDSVGELKRENNMAVERLNNRPPRAVCEARWIRWPVTACPSRF